MGELLALYVLGLRAGKTLYNTWGWTECPLVAQLLKMEGKWTMAVPGSTPSGLGLSFRHFFEKQSLCGSSLLSLSSFCSYTVGYLVLFF